MHGLLGYLNTSYVKVQWDGKTYSAIKFINLNTSYVKVQYILLPS